MNRVVMPAAELQAPPMTISMALLPMIDIQAIMKASGSTACR